MSIVVCIPSYKRSQLCNDQTLNTLNKHKIDSKLIYVFVANKNEYKDYKKVLNPKFYNRLIIGKKGLVQQRDYISNYFNTGKQIVFFDDDVKNIDLTLSPRFKKSSLYNFFKDVFKDCIKYKSFIWGVYPVYNPYFRKDKAELSTSLKYIVGAFYGIINRPKLSSIRLIITRKNGQKEDVERTIKYFKNDGIVLRYNKIGFETKYYGKDGGLGTFEARLKPMKEASEKLKKKYPEYGEIKIKKTGMTEFRLKILQSNPTMNLKKSKTHKNKTHKSKTHKSKTHKNKTHKNKTHKSKTHKSKTHKNKTHKNKTHKNKTHKNKNE